MIQTVQYIEDKQLSKHFALHEFKCKESNTIKYCEELIDLLEKMFDTYLNIGKAIIESAYRTPDYSVKVDGMANDAHTVGIAVDIKWYDTKSNLISPKYIACAAQEMGFTGIGIMKNSIHLDNRTTETYKNGKWWGDETTGNNNIKDFFSYFKLSKNEVNKFLGKKEEKISVTYQVWGDKQNKWFSNVTDLDDYAGVLGEDICAIYANLSKGNITYSVHDKKKKCWLPAVVNRKDFAGVFNRPIDGLMMKTDTGKTIHYRVHLRRANKWLPYVTGYDTKDSKNGYAGNIGQEIDAIQIYID